jgi:hypothetical protein
MKIGGNKLELRTSRALSRRIVEKPHAVSNLRQDVARDHVLPTARVERRNSSRSSRSGTGFPGGLDRRGVESRFVAQVLGQIFGPARDSALLASRAYARSGQPQNARLVQVL